MIEGHKKSLSIFVVVILVSASIAAVVTFGIENIKEKEEDKLPLTVKIFADPKEGVIPFETSFSSIITNYEGDISYSWDFGNGNTSSERNPTIKYAQNGTFTCKLVVEDEVGDKGSDTVKIHTINNRPPTVSIEAATDKPRRPTNIFIEFGLQNSIIEPILRTESYGSQGFRWLRDRGYLDILFKNQESFYTVEAIANDPDEDEIVSYNWTLKAPSYSTRIGNKPVDPEYHYTGKVVNIPTKDIFPAQDYSLTLTVRDSAGQKRSETMQFKVKKSQIKDNIEGIRKSLNNQKSKWVSEWKTNEIIGKIGFLAFNLVVFKFLSRTPLAKLIAIIMIDLVLQTDLSDYTDYDNLMDPLKDLTDNRTWAHNFIDKGTNWLQEKSPDIAQSLAEFFGAREIEELREYLEFENKRPVVSNPSPQNDAMLININTSKIWISVFDDTEEDDRFNVSIYCEYIDTADHYVNFTNVNNSNNPFNATLINPLPRSTQIEWSVTVEELNNPEEKFTKNYKFMTGYE